MRTARPKRYPTPEHTGWLTTTQICDQMGWDLKHTLRMLRKFRAVLPRPRRPPISSKLPLRWPASIIEDLRALTGLPYDEIDPQSDWLARYLQEGPHGTDRERRSSEC